MLDLIINDSTELRIDPEPHYTSHGFTIGIGLHTAEQCEIRTWIEFVELQLVIKHVRWNVVRST